MPGVTAGGTTAPRGGSRMDRAGAPDMCSEPSQPMFRPDGADLFVCRELTARSFSQRIVYVRFFLWREHVRRLDNARRGRLKDLFHGSLPPLRLIAHARSYLALVIFNLERTPLGPSRLP